MKKMTIVLAVAVIVAIAGSAMAFDIPTSGSGVKDAVKNEAVKQVSQQAAKPINNELNKGKYQCTWDTKTNSVTGCDLKTIAMFLSGQRLAVETAAKKLGNHYSDYNIYIHGPSASQTTVSNELKKYGVGSWDIYNKSTSGNKIAFSVEIE